MLFNHVETIEVRMFGKTVGALAPDARRRPYYAFEYAPSWLRNGYSISPLHLPPAAGVFSFDHLAENTWHRLPAAIAETLRAAGVDMAGRPWDARIGRGGAVRQQGDDDV